jgi:hypothetical protein
MGIGKILKRNLVNSNELDKIKLRQYMPVIDYKFETNLFYNKENDNNSNNWSNIFHRLYRTLPI